MLKVVGNYSLNSSVDSLNLNYGITGSFDVSSSADAERLSLGSKHIKCEHI